MTPSSEQRNSAAQAASAIERAVDHATQQLAVLQAAVAARDAEIERLQDVCDDRQRVIVEVCGHSETYRRAAEERAGLVAALDFTLQRLQADFERSKADVQKAKLERDNAVAVATNATAALDQQRHEVAVAFAEVAARDAARERLQEVCDERDRLIQELNERCSDLRRAAEERAGMAATLQEEVQRLRREVDRIERERSRTATSSEAAALAFEEERQRVRLLCGEHDAALRDALRSVETLRARIAILEEAVTGRAGVIVELQAACDERLALIGRLSDEIEALRNIAEERRLLLESNDATRRVWQAPDDRPEGTDGTTDWRAVAGERKRALDAITAEAERRAVLLADVTAALEGRTRENEELRGRVTRAS
jgi:DNA repair exonuclease SbcCD ATPase subunit